MTEYHDLIDIKIQLDSELKAYQVLLEGEVRIRWLTELWFLQFCVLLVGWLALTTIFCLLNF